MEVSQEFSYDLRLKSNRLYKAEPQPRRQLSPQEEKIELIKKIEAISASNRGLREKQDGLQNTVTILSFRSTICENCWSLWVKKAWKNVGSFTLPTKYWSGRRGA
jgi:hypothetical protein